MNRFVSTLAILFLANLLGACHTDAPGAMVSSKPRFGTFGVDLAGMDRTVKPGDDFYRYVNGNWVQHEVLREVRENGASSLLDHPLRIGRARGLG